MKFDIDNIDWDIDELGNDVENELPKSISNADIKEITDTTPPQKYDEIISEWLLDEYGWGVLGFTFKKCEVHKKRKTYMKVANAMLEIDRAKDTAYLKDGWFEDLDGIACEVDYILSEKPDWWLMEVNFHYSDGGGLIGDISFGMPPPKRRRKKKD